MKEVINVFLLLCPVLYTHAQSSFQPFIDSLAKAYLQNHPGVLVIGIHDNGNNKIFYYGETAKGNSQKPDSGSIFEIGGLTETFTSALYADMSLKGIVKTDEKLQDLLPVSIPAPVYQEIICQKADVTPPSKEFEEHEHVRINFTPYVCFPDPSTKPQYIILCDLATHTTGLPQNPGNLKKKNKNNPFANYTKDNLYSFLKEYRFAKPLGYDYNHSNVGIALLGHALELKAKTDFDTLLTQHVLIPLKMSDTGIHLSEQQQKRLLNGYDKNGNAVQHWTYDVMAPAGGLHSTPHDMVKFLAANLSVQKDYYTNLLDYTHNARLKLSGKKEDTEIALGWKINSLGADEKRVVWQEGFTGGFSSYIGFVETNHTGVVVLSSVSKNANSVGVEILKKLSHQKL